MIRYPNIIGKTDAQKLDQMRSYLHQLADELNYQLDKTGNIGSGFPSSAVDGSAVAKPIKKDDAISNFNDIKALIIKSADIVDAYYEEINKKLEGQYVAESDFGTYKEKTQAQLNASSDRIDVVVEKQEEIDTDLEDLERTLRSEIEQTADSITLTVENGMPGGKAQIRLKVGEEEYAGEIDLTGVVTFESLAQEGRTVINGGNITTGTILADLIKAGVLKSKDGNGVVIDLERGVSSLARGTAASFTDLNGEDVEADIAAFIIRQATIMQNETVKDYAFTVDAKGFAEGANVQLHKFTNNDGMNSLSATFFWTNGKLEHWIFHDEGMNDAWYLARKEGSVPGEMYCEFAYVVEWEELDTLVDNEASWLPVHSTKIISVKIGIGNPYGSGKLTIHKSVNEDLEEEAVVSLEVSDGTRWQKTGNYYNGWRWTLWENCSPSIFAERQYVDMTAICYGEYAISSLNETDAVMTAIVNSIGGYGKRFIMFNYNGQLFGCTVYRGSERYSWAEADSYTSDNAYKMHRVMLAGVWQPWEWENPPMKVDEEYRTTERWNGKPVYQKLVSLGALPNASIRRYENVASFAHIVDLRLVIKTKDEIDAADRLAAFSGMSVYGSSTASIWAEAQSNLAVNTYSWDASNYIGFAMMKYVK